MAKAKKKPKPKDDDVDEDDIAERWLAHRTAFMQRVLGKRLKTYKPSGWPFKLGGKVDIFFYPRGIPGTGFATLDLSQILQLASQNKVFDYYELVMFTRAPMSLPKLKRRTTKLGRAFHNARGLLTSIGWGSAERSLNPGNTVEFPDDGEEHAGKCFIVDDYSGHRGVVDKHLKFGVMVVIEIFRSEMKWACKRDGSKLIAKLKEAGHYPYTDMNRKPVA